MQLWNEEKSKHLFCSKQELLKLKVSQYLRNYGSAGNLKNKLQISRFYNNYFVTEKHCKYVSRVNFRIAETEFNMFKLTKGFICEIWKGIMGNLLLQNKFKWMTDNCVMKTYPYNKLVY